MNTPRVCAVCLALCACAAIAQPLSAQTLAGSHREQAQFLLGQIEQQLGKIRNFRCHKITPVVPGTLTSDADITGYRHEWITSDAQGRGRVRISEEGRISTQIWDGERTIGHLVQVDPNGAVTHQVSVATGIHCDIQRHQMPWDYLGRDLVNLLTGALENGSTIRVSPMNADRYRLDVRDGSGALHTIILDAQQGYAPIQRRVYVDGKVRTLETVTFEEVTTGIWFPVQVRTEVGPQETRLPAPVLKYRFANITFDRWDFERSLRLGLAEGTEIQDGISGQTLVVDENTIDSLARRTSAPMDANVPAPVEQAAAPTWRTAFDAVYQLEEGEVLKCVAPPFIAQRHEYLVSAEPSLAGLTARAIENRLYQFDWDNGLENNRQIAPRRFLELASVLENIVGLDSHEYAGLSHLLGLPVTGDWIVRKDVPTEQLLINLEHIIQKQRQRSIAFVRQEVETIVVRASGTYQFRALPGLAADDGVHIHAGDVNALLGQTARDTRCDIVGHFLEDVADGIGMFIVDNTQSPEADLCWVWHDSAQLRHFRNAPSIFNPQLVSLLDNLSRQTGLAFTIELGRVDQWQVTAQRNVAARAN